MINTIKCPTCGGTIGKMEEIVQQSPPNSQYSTLTEYWFHCLYCQSQNDPADILISIELD